MGRIPTETYDGWGKKDGAVDCSLLHSPRDDGIRKLHCNCAEEDVSSALLVSLQVEIPEFEWKWSVLPTSPSSSLLPNHKTLDSGTLPV